MVLRYLRQSDSWATGSNFGVNMTSGNIHDGGLVEVCALCMLSSFFLYFFVNFLFLCTVGGYKRFKSRLNTALLFVSFHLLGTLCFVLLSINHSVNQSPDIVPCDTLPRFRRELKTFLFRQSYPSILI